MNTLLPVFILLLSVSCSTSWNELFEEENSEKRNKKLMESFGAEEEVLEKFSEKESAGKPKEKNLTKAKAAKKSGSGKAKQKDFKSSGKTSKKASKETSKKTSKKTAKSGGKRNSKKTVVVLTPSEKRGGGPVVIPAKSVEDSSPEIKPLPAFPKDYPDELIKMSVRAKRLWEEYDPLFFSGETIVMDINYMGISTGKIVLSTKRGTNIGGQDVYHVSARVKTSDYYRYLYELDDDVDSYISKASLTPVKFSLIQRESGKDVDDLQLFDREELKTYSYYKRVKDGDVKKKKVEKQTPLFYTDPLYVIWFLRGLPMEEGKTFTAPIMNRGKIIELKARNEGVETLETALGKRRAYRVKASTSYTGETLKSGDMTFWFSADQKRTFLKFKAKIKIGSISGDIEKYDP